MLGKLKYRLKSSEHPFNRALFQTLKSLRSLEIPAPRIIYLPLLTLHLGIARLLIGFLRIFYWTPLFKSRLDSCGRRLRIDRGMPMIIGEVKVSVGDNVNISGSTAIAGRTGLQTPELILGNDVVIGWLTGITVGTRIVIGNNVMLSGRSTLSGYPGHPLNPTARMMGQPDTEDQIGDIILEDGVWLGIGVVVTPNVRIGKGTVVAAGSIVTHDLPPNVLAGGMPARVIAPLPDT